MKGDEKQTLVIRKQAVGEAIAEHGISLGKEKLIRYPRYYRDQFAIIHRVIQQYPISINSVLTKCVTEKLYSAINFRDIAYHLHTTNHQPVQELESLYSNPAKHSNIVASTRSLNTYTSILGGRV